MAPHYLALDYVLYLKKNFELLNDFEAFTIEFETTFG
jgi:hypothetical protein